MSKLVRLDHFGGKEVLRTEELDVSQPDAGEVFVSVRAASVNPVDFKIRSGKYPAVRSDRLPYTLGRDVSGIVERCGAQSCGSRLATRSLVWSEPMAADIRNLPWSTQDAIAISSFAKCELIDRCRRHF
jgi:NADPH:quinone reductase-like Zn-dependent oxidoreductase